MPVTRRYPIERLMAACRDYRERTGPARSSSSTCSSTA